MLKNLTGGAVINYGPVLPAGSTAFVGAVFYLTETDGNNAPGLYIFGVNQRSVEQVWTAVVESAAAPPPPPPTVAGNGNYDILLIDYGII